MTSRVKQWHKKQQNKIKKIFKKIHNFKMMITKPISKIQTNFEKNPKRKKKAKNNSKTISKLFIREPQKWWYKNNDMSAMWKKNGFKE